MDKIKILLADDHELFRKGIVSLLENEENIEIIDEASNGKELVQKYFTNKPDVVIADISMPGLSGTDALKSIREKDDNAKVLFLSMYGGEDYIYHCYKSGGKGLVNKNISKPELLFAIKEIFKGNLYFGPDYNESKIVEIVESYEKSSSQVDLLPLASLTQKEEEIIKLISQGLTSSEISERLFIAKRTVDSHRYNLMQKLGLKSLPQLIKFSIAYSDSIKKQRNEGK